MRQALVFLAVAVAVTLALPSASYAYDPPTPETGLSSGAWADSIPIECPPAPGGAAPSLAIHHQHTTPDGSLGTGFFLSGTSVITRHSENGGVPGHTWADSYRVDGRPLVMVAAGGVYEPQTYDGTRFWLDTATNTWTMKKDGWTWTYGSTGSTGTYATKRLYGADGRSQYDTTPFPFDTPSGPCSSITAPCNTVAWYLSQAVDPNGNTLKYDYVNPAMPASITGYFETNTRDRLLSKITYANGNATIDLTYEERPDPRLSVASGTPTFLAHRLASIVSRGLGGAFYARYELQYKDESTDTLAQPDEDLLQTRPIQTLLWRVFRTDEAGAQRRLVRAYDTWNQALTWTNDDITAAIPAPHGIWGTTSTLWSTPIPLNLNGDAVSDLALLSYECGPMEHPNGPTTSGCIADHHVYVATPGAAQPFAGASSSADAAAWEVELEARAGGTDVFLERGYAIGDIDRDGTPEVLWEDPTTGGVKVSFYSRVTHAFTVVALPTTSFTAGDLQRTQLADVDGDGYPDAILRPHSFTTQWIRNLGQSPWFDRADMKTLEVPLEAATPPAEWSAIQAAHCTGKPTVPHGNTLMDPEHFANQSRFVDMNGDGLIDLVYALYACWHGSSSNDTPVSESLYSRIFWGDGYGEFIDSGLSAGPAFAQVLPGTPLAASTFSAADLDRDGHVELLQAESIGVAYNVEGAYDRGIVDGYALDPNRDYAPADFSMHIPAFSGGSPEHFATLADFDGDGFADLLDVRLPEHVSGETWDTSDWEVRLHRSTRTAAQGRVVAAHDAWGGTTSLTWGFSAQSGNDNPDLPVNVEVLKQVSGSEGPVKLRYAQGGYEGSSGFTGFGLVERQNARGGSELFGFATVPALAGQPTHAVRYRTDGSIETATVYAYGGRTAQGGWTIDLEPPFDNPLVRRCDFDLGFGVPALLPPAPQSFALWDLIHDCYAFGTDWSHVPSQSQLLVAQGRYRNPPDASGQGAYELAAAVWAAPGEGAESVELSWLGESTNGHRFDFALPWTETRTIGYRWTPPSGVATPPLLAPGTGAAAYPAGTSSTQRAFYATDWTYDPSTRELLSLKDHRDTSTTADDRIHTLTHSTFDTSKWGRRLTVDRTTDANGAQLARVTRSNFDPASFDHARTVETCGTGTTSCPTEQFAWGGGGELTSHTFADATTESWTRTWCGAELSYTDQVARTRTRTVNSKCLVASETWQGARTDFVYDAFLRQTKRTFDPNGAGPNTVVDTYYDDDLQIAADSGFAEPRMGEKRGDGRLELTYLDDFGRVTRKVACTAASGTGNAADGVLGAATCAAGTATVAEYRLFGTDGEVKASARPFAGSEIVRVAAFTRDGHGRAIATHAPAHVDGAAASQWIVSLAHHGPTWTESVDPLGHTTRVTSTTLSSVTERAGVVREQVTFDAFGARTSVVAADGVTTTFDYDAFHRPIHEAITTSAPCVLDNGTVSTCTHERTWKYDTMGRVTRVIEPNGNMVDRTYDAAGRLDQVWLGPVSTGKLVADVDYVAASGASSFVEQHITDEAGNMRVTTLDGFGRPRTTSILGTTESTSYGASGLMSSSTDKDGFVTNYTYDPLDRVATRTAPATGQTSYVFDGAGHLLQTTDADGTSETRSYVQSGALAAIKRGPYTLRRRTYDADGRVTGELNSGVQTSTQYDSLDRPSHRDVGVDPSNGAVSWTEDLTWDTGDRPLTSTLAPTAGGSTATTLAYDAWGRLSTVTRPTSGTTTVQYDVNDRARYVTDGEGYRREMRYDARGRVAYRDVPGRGSEAIAFTAPASFGATAGLQLTTVTDADGYAQKVYSDALGRAVIEVRADGSYVQRQFTGSHLAQEDWRDAAAALLRTRKYQYSATTGRLTRTDGPATSAELAAGTEHRVSRTYTAAGRALTIGTFDETTTFGWSSGFLASEAWGSLTRTMARADLDHPWVTTETLASGASQRVRTLDRDAAGRLELEIVSDGAHTITRTWTGYDAYGHAQEAASYRDGTLDARDVTTFDKAGRPTVRDSYLGATLAGETLWEWYRNGALKGQRTPSGKWMAYDYGAAFDYTLDRVHDKAGTNYARFTARNGRGLATSVALTGTTLALQYDALGRVTRRDSTSAQQGNTTWEATFDAAGLLRQEHYVDGASNWYDAYDYDGAGRLVHESRGLTGEVYDYTIDKAGKRLTTSRSVNGGASSAILTATYSGTKLASVTSGGITKTLSYSPWEEVTTDQNGYTYARNADGSLRTVTANNAATTITRDAAGVPVAIDEGDPDPRIIARGLDPDALPIEVQEPDGDDVTYVEAEGLLLSRVAPGMTAVELRDEVGSVTRYRGNKLDHGTAFGASVTPPAADERYLFAGLERLPRAPAVELAQHREYDPATGRFLSQDPTGLRGGFHRTLYADGNPVQKRDPQGLLAITIDGSTVDYTGFQGVIPGQPYIPPGDTPSSDGTTPPPIDIGALTAYHPQGCFPVPTGSLGAKDNSSTDVDPSTDPNGDDPATDDPTASDPEPEGEGGDWFQWFARQPLQRGKVSAPGRGGDRTASAGNSADPEPEGDGADWFAWFARQSLERGKSGSSDGGKDKGSHRSHGHAAEREAPSEAFLEMGIPRSIRRTMWREGNEETMFSGALDDPMPGVNTFPASTEQVESAKDHEVPAYVFRPTTSTVLLAGDLSDTGVPTPSFLDWFAGKVVNAARTPVAWEDRTAERLGIMPRRAETMGWLAHCAIPGGCDLSQVDVLVVDTHGEPGLTVGAGKPDDFAKMLVQSGFRGKEIILFVCGAGADYRGKVDGGVMDEHWQYQYEDKPSTAAVLAAATGADVVAGRGLDDGKHFISVNLAGYTYADPKAPDDAGHWVIFHPDGTRESYDDGQPAP